MPITLDGTTGITSPAIDLTVTPLTIVDGGTGATSLTAATIATLGYTTTATAAGTTTLTASSTATQFFTGSTTQTIVLPVASTMTQGQQFSIHNNSSGSLTVNSSGANLVGTLTANTTATITCILTTGTTAASWDFDLTGFTTALPVARGGTGLTALGTANQVLAVNAGATALEFQTAAGGQFQTELFTAPGTWTKPASCTQVRVTVIGAGGGGSPGGGNPGAATAGGTSSFGALVSATGGNGAGPTNPSNGAAGSATVSTGTAIIRKSFPVAGTGLTLLQLQGEYYSVGSITGRLTPGSVSAVAYSVTGLSMAGAGGLGDNADGRLGGPGGVAVAISPVSGPVAITVGSGGNPNNPPGSPQGGGTGGAVLVEFVG